MGNGIMSSVKPCNGCGKKRKLKKVGSHQLCSKCEHIATTLKENPELFTKISKMTDLPLPECDCHEDIELPEVLDAVRYKTQDRDMNTWYVSISEQNGNPVEMFASTAFDRDHHLQSRISNLTTITRLVSLILRHIFLKERLTLEKTLTQLRRSSRQPNDLPDMLSRVLTKYSHTPYPEEHDSNCV